MFKWILLFIFYANGGLAKAISCFECNQLPHEKQNPCPAKRTVDYGLKYDVSLSKSVSVYFNALSF